MHPSTKWREQIDPDEANRFDRYAEAFVKMQQRKSQEFGYGRALHRKQILALRAVFDVLPDLPETARHGLFASPARYEAWIRLSNGGPNHAPDSKPDIRGFAVKVFGVAGPTATASLDWGCQDFLLINHSTFAFPKSEEFMDLTLASDRGLISLLTHIWNRYGAFRGVALMRRLAGVVGKPFRSFACETFYSAAPISCGPYACRLRLVPNGNPPSGDDVRDWARDVKDRLALAPLAFDFQLQFFVDEASTPIENASVDWPEMVAPFVTVARLIIPQQEFSNAAATQFDAQVEASSFDPWTALMVHRPLGNVMRARRVVYLASRSTRGAP